MRRTILTAVVAGIVGAVVAAPVAVYASHSFTDVPNTNTFHSDITWMKDSGVTKGCNPPANDEYCPDDNVTREQMAAFMHRLAENQVVDADKVDGIEASEFVEENESKVIGTGMLKSNAVTAGKTRDEAGIATTANSALTSLVPGTQELLSVTLDAPASGYVIVTATAEIISNHTAGVEDRVQWGIAETGTGFDVLSAIPTFRLPANSSTGYWNQLLADHQVYEVDAGSKTFYMIADLESGSSLIIDDPTITAQFVATGYGTIDTTGASSGSVELAPGEG